MSVYLLLWAPSLPAGRWRDGVCIGAPLSPPLPGMNKNTGQWCGTPGTHSAHNFQPIMETTDVFKVHPYSDSLKPGSPTHSPCLSWGTECHCDPAPRPRSCLPGSTKLPSPLCALPQTSSSFPSQRRLAPSHLLLPQGHLRAAPPPQDADELWAEGCFCWQEALEQEAPKGHTTCLKWGGRRELRKPKSKLLF